MQKFLLTLILLLPFVAGAQVMDDRFSLYPLSNGNDVLFFADDKGEDNSIDISQIAIFDTTLTGDEISGVDLFTNQGQCIHSYKVSGDLVYLDLTGIPGGIYFLKIHTRHDLLVRKITVK